MGIAVDVATEDLAREIAVYWVDGGMPENFSLPGLDPAPIVFSTRFLEIASTLFRLIRENLLSGELLADVGERIGLQVIAELVLKRGDPATACYLMTRSLFASHSVTLTPSTISSLEMEELNESYMTVWFSALLHEIGHVHADETRTGDVVPPEALQDRVTTIFERLSYPAPLVAELMTRLAARDVQHSLHPKQLQTEIAADIFGVHALWQATVTVLDKDGRVTEFDPVRLALDVIDMFSVLVMLNNCALVARQATDHAFDVRDEHWIAVAYHVRIDFLVDYLAMLLASVTTADHREEFDSRRWREILVPAGADKKDRLDGLESGITRAMRQTLWPAERQTGLGTHLTQQLDSTEALTRWLNLHLDCGPFLALADALEISHLDVERLRTTLQRATERPPGRTFHLLWFHQPDGEGIPLGLHTRYGYLIFVFHSDRQPYQDFRESIALGLEPGTVVDEVTIVSDWEYDVITICWQALPAQLRQHSRVVIEGSPLFDTLWAQLTDGSLWPDPPDPPDPAPETSLPERNRL